jgi:hydrogenase maturation factor
LCELFDLNPLQTISSGSLIIVIDDSNSEELLQLLHENGIVAKKIGNLTPDEKYTISRNEKIHEIAFSERDEITKIFDEDQ